MQQPSTVSATDALAKRWQAAWPDALMCWSRYTRLSQPIWCKSQQQAKSEGLTGSFAMIRFVDQRVVINLQALIETGLEAFAPQVLAHEIGHHVYAPGNATDHVRCLARVRNALLDQRGHAAYIANLYTDLLINDRLQRSAGLDMAAVFQALVASEQAEAQKLSRVWSIYLRVYELLWTLPKQRLCLNPLTDAQEADARLMMRQIRHFASDWLTGSGGFAMLMYPHLVADARQHAVSQQLMDMQDAAADCEISGLSAMEDDELNPALSPNEQDGLAPGQPDAHAKGPGQARDPFEFGELLRAAGIRIDASQAAINYYRELATPHLIKFPSQTMPVKTEPLIEGLRAWEAGDHLDAIDWLQTLLSCPVPIPGVTTVQRQYGESTAQLPIARPMDLAIYVDCSGSMPDPKISLSYPTLAGAVLALSALRAGAFVQATLWSDKSQVISTGEFVRDENQLLGILTGYLGGGTQFPLPLLRDTFAARSRFHAPAHILVISDDGASTMFDSPDERGVSGFEVCAKALQQARGGGSLVLQIAERWDLNNHHPALQSARDDYGWAVHAVQTLDALLAFAREFAERNYG